MSFGMAITVAECIIYPLKSGAGISVDHAIVTPRGLNNDRLFVLVDNNGNFINQRSTHKMATIHSEIDESGITFSAPGKTPLAVTPSAFTDQIIPVSIWNKAGEGYAADREVNEWFSSYLDKAVRLLRMNDEFHRRPDPKFSQTGDEVSFADGYPILVASNSSFQALAPYFNESVSINRFRPNLILDGSEPFAEDVWQRIRVGSVELEIVKHCERCVMINVDPDTGTMPPDASVTPVMGKYRLGLAQNGDGKRAMLFAENAIPRSTGVINAGDSVEILEEKPLDKFVSACKINALNFRP
jgi:uncharacterized protein YcbX